MNAENKLALSRQAAIEEEVAEHQADRVARGMATRSLGPLDESLETPPDVGPRMGWVFAAGALAGAGIAAGLWATQDVGHPLMAGGAALTLGAAIACGLVAERRL